MRFALFLAALLSASPLFAPPLLAQHNGVQLQIALASPAAVSEPPVVTTSGLLSDPNTREILRAGFATQIRYRVELWKQGGLFNDLSGRAEWSVSVYFDPNDQLYHVIRQQDKQFESFGGFASITAAEAQFGRAFRPPVHPTRGGRYYYVLTIEVQPMQESDLDALQQWLRGPSSPTKNSVVIALRGGVGRLLSRVLGGDKQKYTARSGVFRVP